MCPSGSKNASLSEARDKSILGGFPPLEARTLRFKKQEARDPVLTDNFAFKVLMQYLFFVQKLRRWLFI